MSDRCETCDAPLVRFAVPTPLRECADGASAAICTRCLDVTTGDAVGSDGTVSDEPAFDRVHETFPTGEGGAAFALLVGTLPSVTLRKDDALAVREYAQRRGVDTRLAFDRLIDASEAGALEPAFDLRRRVRSFESLADGA